MYMNATTIHQLVIISFCFKLYLCFKSVSVYLSGFCEQGFMCLILIINCTFSENTTGRETFFVNVCSTRSVAYGTLRLLKRPNFYASVYITLEWKYLFFRPFYLKKGYFVSAALSSFCEKCIWS